MFSKLFDGIFPYFLLFSSRKINKKYTNMDVRRMYATEFLQLYDINSIILVIINFI